MRQAWFLLIRASRRDHIAMGLEPDLSGLCTWDRRSLLRGSILDTPPRRLNTPCILTACAVSDASWLRARDMLARAALTGVPPSLRPPAVPARTASSWPASSRKQPWRPPLFGFPDTVPADLQQLLQRAWRSGCRSLKLA